jgi:hypothetical protein
LLFYLISIGFLFSSSSEAGSYQQFPSFYGLQVYISFEGKEAMAADFAVAPCGVQLMLSSP